MKENEMPEKIYVDNPNHDFWYRTKDKNSIEYTRTDAFIKKASKWLQEHSGDYLLYPFCEFDKGALLEDFKKAMEE